MRKLEIYLKFYQRGVKPTRNLDRSGMGDFSKYMTIGYRLYIFLVDVSAG